MVARKRAPVKPSVARWSAASVSVTHGRTPIRPSHGPRTLDDPAEADERDLRRIDHPVHGLHALVTEVGDGDRRVGQLGSGAAARPGPGRPDRAAAS